MKSDKPLPTLRDTSLLGRLAVAADHARYEWHCFRHGGKYDACNQPECQEVIALYAEYCAARASTPPPEKGDEE